MMTGGNNGMMGRSDVAVINLDPANDALPYDCDVDISDLITLTDVMDAYDLGPNGGLVYCMEYLEKNIDWLKERITPLESNPRSIYTSSFHLCSCHHRYDSSVVCD
jgi:GTPase SAR1 family protein